MINYDKDREFWEDLYISGDTTWDLGGPTPIFERLSKNINPGKLCILGCGKGHDAVMFAKKDLEVTAVDFSLSAINFLKQSKIDIKIASKLLNVNLEYSNKYNNNLTNISLESHFIKIYFLWFQNFTDLSII